MRDLLATEADTPQVSSSFPATDAGGGLIMVLGIPASPPIYCPILFPSRLRQVSYIAKCISQAMNARAKWEVRIFFETDAT